MNKIISSEYKEWLKEIKQKFQSSQIKASIQVNSTLLVFYWNLGNEIVEKQKNSTWGSGFAYVGRQYKLIVGDDEFRIDLLFYHIKLKCYVVVELKATEFKPEFAGKLSFYTSAVDGEIKDKNDNPAIGILICKSKNDLVVEYAFKDINKPLGISQYELTEILPKEYKSSLPSIEEIEAQFENENLKAVDDE